MTSPEESDVVLIATDAVLLANRTTRTPDDATRIPEVSVTAVATEEDDIPLATMELVPQESCQQLNIERRPAILCVTVLKSKKSSGAGILLEESDEVLQIAEIEPESIFDKTPLMVGDHVLSVNNISCDQMNAARASRLFQRAAKGSVTMVVHRTDGDPYLVSTTVTKPEPTSRVGVGVQIYNGSLRISSIDPSGLFAGSILKVGDSVVSICDISCACMDANAAIELIRQEERTVTIVTWTEAEAGVVVAATKAIPFITRYKMLLPCLFSIILLTIISLIVALTSRDSHSSDDDGDRPCRNLYGQPIPYC